ncbi:MAG: SPOR domain-containing protein [Candidatus Lernaella stagnicola]|nr:SPOR domain-containing protein [Candidatus Lernaella stagnicola]
MRDLRKLRSKYEVKLDNRHIAYLLIAELVIVAVFFALGVVVGKGMGQLDRSGAIVAASPTPEAPTPVVLETPTPEIEFPATPIVADVTPEPTPDMTPEPTPEGPILDSEQPVVTPTPSEADLAPAVEPDPTQIDIGALPQPTKSGDYWTVQVGSYPTKKEAKAMYDRMAASGNVAAIETADLGDRGTWYRISVGQYATDAGARAVASALRQRENIDTWVRYVP